MQEKHPIAVAVAPLKQASVDAAVERSKRYLADMKRRVKEQPDLRILAPRPSYNMNNHDYRQAQHYRASLLELTKDDKRQPISYLTNAPEMVVWDSKKAKLYIEQTIAFAEAAYIEYVDKLIGKVERENQKTAAADVVSECGVWSESILRVKLASGIVEHWKTQMIVNCSVYGKVFNQFPTRLMKEKKARRKA